MMPPGLSRWRLSIFGPTFSAWAPQVATAPSLPYATMTSRQN